MFSAEAFMLVLADQRLFNDQCSDHMSSRHLKKETDEKTGRIGRGVSNVNNDSA
jgi:hypothetical protein